MTAKSQLGAAQETVFGTFVTPAHYYEFTGEGVKWDQERIDSRAWRAGTRVISSTRWKPGGINVAGNIDMEVATHNFGLWFYNAFGAGTITSPGTATARLHTFTLGDLIGKSMSIQAGIEDRGGTALPFSFLGCKIQTFEFRCAIGELLTVSAGILGQDMTTAQGLGTAAYPASQELFSFIEGTLSIAGTAINVREFSMAIDNGLADDFVFGSGLTREPTEPALRAVTGAFNADFVGLTEFNRFKEGTEAELNLLFDTGTVIEAGSTYSLEITANVRYDGETPSVDGPEAVNLPVAYTVTAPSAAEPVTLEYVTTDTSY